PSAGAPTVSHMKSRGEQAATMGRNTSARGRPMSYAERLYALGRTLDLRHMRDVCITEVEDGFVVSGIGRVSRSEGEAIEPVTLRIQGRNLPVEGPREPPKRGWPW